MDSKTKNGFKRGLANFFGGLGYLTIVLQWLWAVLLYFSYLIAFDSFINPEVINQPIKPIEQVVSGGTNIFSLIIVIIITVAVLALSLFTLYKIPSTVVRGSRKVVRQTAESAAPLIINAQHKPETKKAKLKLTVKLILVIKLVVLVIPIILAYVSQFQSKQSFDFNVALTISILLAGISFVLFAIQYLLAWALKVEKQRIW